MGLVKRLTIRSMGLDIGDVKRALEDAGGKSTDVARVVGAVDKVEEGEGDYGRFVKFFGQFRGVRLDTGEMFDSGCLLLPDVAADAVEGAVKAAEGGRVELGFDIGARKAETPTGYEWTATPLIKAGADSDPMARLLDVAAETKPLAIDAPKQQEGKKTAKK